MDEPSWVLTEEEANVVYDFLYIAQAKWYELGLMLGLKTYELDVIKLNSQNELLDMLKLWLRSTDTTWPHIIEALQRPNVGLHDLARRVRDKHCRGYLLRDEIRKHSLQPPAPNPNPAPEPSPINNNGKDGEGKGDLSSNHGRNLTRWNFAGLLIVICLCIGFAFGGITLLAVGLRGFANDEDYSCSLGPSGAYDALNTITGVAFMSGVIVILLYILYVCFKHHQRFKKVMTVVIIGFIAVSLIFIVVDMVYSFYVASQLLPEVQRWENNKSLCGDGVFRSAFGIIVTYFLLVFAAVATGAVGLAYLVFQYTKCFIHLDDCFKDTENQS